LVLTFPMAKLKNFDEKDNMGTRSQKGSPNLISRTRVHTVPRCYAEQKNSRDATKEIISYHQLH
jgi:hypothetical protein